jgi:integrase/recombinase XerD
MLNEHVARYVALHRQLGLRYNQQERILGLFAAYAEGLGDRYITTDRIRSWCATASTPSAARTWFDTVRRFSLFLSAEEPEPNRMVYYRHFLVTCRGSCDEFIDGAV